MIDVALKTNKNLSDRIFQHQLKQRVFAKNAEALSQRNCSKSFAAELEVLKQNAVYVGLARKGSKGVTPYDVGLSKARRQPN